MCQFFASETTELGVDMNTRFALLFLIIVFLLMVTVPSEAHHSASSFWHTDRTVVIEGTVKEIRMVNPHPEMVIEVTDANGEKSDWYISGGGNASAMIRAGWTNDTLIIGEKVKVEGNPSRREGAKALLSGDVTKSDGSVVSFDSGSAPIQ
jgi:hypothetical protein